MNKTRIVATWMFVFISTAFGQEAVPGLGDIFQWAVPLAGVGLGLAHENPHGEGMIDREGLQQYAWSYGTTLGVTYALKYGLQTERPNGGKHSFPSGHTASAFTGAGFIQKRYGWGWGAPAYAAAAYTGYSRVANDAHYPRDVIAAAAMASLSTRFFVGRYEKEIQWAPYVPEEGGFGLQLVYRF